MTAATDLARAIAGARPRVIAALAAMLRDLDAAEEAFGEAAATCLALPQPPRDPAAWLFVAAKRRALDARRRQAVEARVAGDLARSGEVDDMIRLPEPIPDERLRLLFICCHPALAVEARAALALRVICGLPVAAIAQAFVTSEQAMFQRITRAKAKVRKAGIAFDLPPRARWPERLDAVMLALELAFTAVYADAGGELAAALGEDLGAEVERLVRLLAELMPEEPEALGLAALVILARSRHAARLDPHGAMVPLSQQDPAFWDRAAIEEARVLLDRAAMAGRSGPRQVMAAIQLAHARRVYGGTTDWVAVLALYDALLALRPSPMAAIPRALALAEVEGAEAGLALLEELPAERLARARPFHVARSRLLARCGREAEALEALDAALATLPPRSERLWLERQRAALSP
ncbi:MAG: sigma factor-like helix-turn-helix DNA-binding protein [Erythrobacter sp.]|uniref:RNA polymerase sigma factor n=1 Tax=Erythrobacter sp. TaxID=1042 RepID=UPI0032EEC038